MKLRRCIYIIVYILPVFFSQGCSNKGGVTNDGILPDTIMVSMIADFFIVEGVMIQLEYLSRKESNSAVPLYNKIFEKHNTTRDDFIKSLEYYAKSPQQLDRIYDLAVQKLSREQIEIGEKAKAIEKE